MDTNIYGIWFTEKIHRNFLEKVQNMKASKTAKDFKTCYFTGVKVNFV